MYIARPPFCSGRANEWQFSSISHSSHIARCNLFMLRIFAPGEPRGTINYAHTFVHVPTIHYTLPITYHFLMCQPLYPLSSLSYLTPSPPPPPCPQMPQARPPAVKQNKKTIQGTPSQFASYTQAYGTISQSQLRALKQCKW